MSLYLFDRERVPGVSVILAIVVVWGWLDAVEIVVGRSDFEDGGPVNMMCFFPHSTRMDFCPSVVPAAILPAAPPSHARR